MERPLATVWEEVARVEDGARLVRVFRSRLVEVERSPRS
jgi:hypothetical protein